MEVYLYYSYLKFRYDNRKPLLIIMKCIPWWLWLLFSLGILGVIVGIMTYDIARGMTWRKVVYLTALCCMGLFFVGIERVQIQDSKVRMENYWKHIEKVRDFLMENGLQNPEDIESIRKRAKRRLVEAKKEMSILKENDEKWLQTFAIPIVLAIITAFVSHHGELAETITNISLVLAVFVVLGICFSGVVGILRSIRNWEITNLTWLEEDLQGVLDWERFRNVC